MLSEDASKRPAVKRLLQRLCPSDPGYLQLERAFEVLLRDQDGPTPRLDELAPVSGDLTAAQKARSLARKRPEMFGNAAESQRNGTCPDGGSKIRRVTRSMGPCSS